MLAIDQRHLKKQQQKKLVWLPIAQRRFAGLSLQGRF